MQSVAERKVTIKTYLGLKAQKLRQETTMMEQKLKISVKLIKL